MKKTIIAFSAAVIVLAAASCRKENVTDTPSSAPVFTATIESGSGTKTTVEREDSEYGVHYKTKWEKDEQININGAVYKATPKEDPTKADFEHVSGTTPSSPYKAYFPAAMYVGTTSTLPASYTYAEGKYNMPMYAESGTTTLEFKNLCGVLAIAVPSTEMSNVDSITVTSDQRMNGAFTATAEGVLTFSTAASTDADRKVTLTFTSTKTISGIATFYIPVPAGTHKPLTINVYYGTSVKTMVTKKSEGVEVKRNTVYPITFKYDQPPLPGLFSVSSDKKVRFSPGNLQYQASTNIWRFAENQYDCIGDAAGNNTKTGREDQEAWIDLFGWGATGENENGQKPYSISTTPSDYKTQATAAAGETLTIANGADWGYCIGGAASKWRTLTTDEWTYLLSASPSGRGTGDGYFKYAVTVAGKTNCLVIAPDGYTGTIQSSYDAAAWINAEKDGLVCLPAAGCRYGSDVYAVGSNGIYWSSTASSESSAYRMYFNSGGVNPEGSDVRFAGYSVRLVSVVQ